MSIFHQIDPLYFGGVEDLRDRQRFNLAEPSGIRSDSIWRALRHYDRSQLPFQIEEIVEQRTYLRNGIGVREGDVVLDVGANVGVVAIFFATECGAGAVHCFEPVAPLFEQLRENVAGFPALRPPSLRHGLALRPRSDHLLPGVDVPQSNGAMRLE